MPAKSKAQFRLMQAAAHGSAKLHGMTKEKAAEYVAGQSPKKLPEKVKRTKKSLSSAGAGKFKEKK